MLPTTSVSGVDHISYVGHSQGSTTLLAALAADKDGWLASAVKFAALLAPAVFTTHIQSIPMATLATLGTDGVSHTAHDSSMHDSSLPPPKNLCWDFISLWVRPALRLDTRLLKRSCCQDNSQPFCFDSDFVAQECFMCWGKEGAA